VGVCALVRSVLDLGPIEYYWFGLMVFVAVVTAHTKVHLIGGSSLSLLTTVALISVMVLGTNPAVLVGICGVFVQCAFPQKRFIPHHFAFNLGMIGLTVSMSGTAYHWIVQGSTNVSDRLVGSLIASLLYYFGNSLCVSLIVALSGRKSMFRLWHDNFLYTAPSFFLAGILAFVVLQLMQSFPAPVLLVVVPILYLSYYSYRVYLRSLENEKKHSAEMADLFNSTLSTLALAIDAKDKNTHGHIQRVQKYARAIAEALRLDEEEITAIAAAALLHDIGKLAVPEYILSKQGPLTPEEMRKMRMHPQLGAEIISNIKFPYPVADSILAHHERFDGMGYPNGLSGKDIPLGARVLTVVDVFDAYVSDHVECDRTINDAIQVVKEGAGTFFDPEIVAVWESIYEKVVSLSPAASSTAYSDIQRATSEIKILESLAESITGLTTVKEIIGAACTMLTNSVADSTVAVQVGEHDGIPVMFGGAVIATIFVHRSGKPLTDDELWLITAVAEKISASLANAMALESAIRDATVDQLTGLANRRAFETACESLAGLDFSIVLVDVNSFKAVNDNFGHKAGDAALVRIGAHLRAAFNHAQLICRLGGDEFVVLTFAQKQELRAQIRKFRSMVVWDPAHEPYKKMLFGVSCGMASVPADAANVKDAMQYADERMYAVKTRFKQWASRSVPV
jgi:diguanylate cyclase (GGDEF)-like protein/putative nucleotidyltransferase with HDIG domain